MRLVSLERVPILCALIMYMENSRGPPFKIRAYEWFQLPHFCWGDITVMTSLSQ